MRVFFGGFFAEFLLGVALAEKDIDKFISHLEMHGNICAAARSTGVSRQTMTRRISRDPLFAERARDAISAWRSNVKSRVVHRAELAAYGGVIELPEADPATGAPLRDANGDLIMREVVVPPDNRVLIALMRQALGPTASPVGGDEMTDATDSDSFRSAEDAVVLNHSPADVSGVVALIEQHAATERDTERDQKIAAEARAAAEEVAAQEAEAAERMRLRDGIAEERARIDDEIRREIEEAAGRIDD